MKIGVDFDNTIACYDELLYRLASVKHLIPNDTQPVKSKIRDALRECGKEDAWTQLQCEAYGRRMREATPFPYVMEFFSFCKKQGIDIYIISHRSLHPVNGEEINLHATARKWLISRGFYNSSISPPENHIYFELTQEEKMRRIAELGCDIFIDDLPEFLNHPAFPSGVKRVLFDPHSQYSKSPSFERLSSWKHYDELIPSQPPGESRETKNFPKSASRFLSSAGFGECADIMDCPGGANNKVFRVKTKQSTLLLKWYFKHPDDTRDRLGNEFSFLSFAWKNGLRCVPQPVACDARRNMALYSFIEGRSILHNEVTEKHIDTALDFFLRLNAYKKQPEAATLPVASEAFFTTEGHIQCVENRLKKLSCMDISSDIDREAQKFVQAHLAPAWKNIKKTVVRKIRAWRHTLVETIPDDDHCLSPSDFGFHNAILTHDEKMYFIDFEYAGWDDPAKMVCDFFYQKKVPAPVCYYDRFIEDILPVITQPKHFLQRLSLLSPVYGMKWCCILLNEFVSAGSARRQFASGVLINETKKAEQLRKTQEHFENFKNTLFEMNPTSQQAAGYLGGFFAECQLR